MFIHKGLKNQESSGGCARRLLAAGMLVAAGMLATGVAQAFPSLDLTPGVPDIASSFITVDYIGNNAAGTLTASGFAQVITPPGSPAGNIAGGSFDINANIDFDNLNATGTLDIGGTVASLGFNSGTLLTGTLDTLGAGPGDPLEFLFTVTGGDAAGLFGSTAGVILNQSGYTGSFDSDFTSGPFQASADTFGPPAGVPAPGTLLLLGCGLLLLVSRPRRSSQH